MHSPKRLKITDVNPHLLCVLCGGYYIDATTVIECLHSFCRSCLVKYLEKNKYCPICDVQIHKTSPLLNIRADNTLQNIVYKLVPSLFKNEMQRRVEFYQKNPQFLPVNPEQRGEITDINPILLPDELLIVCLEYHNAAPIPKENQRYLHCPAILTISHLIKLIKGKFGLNSRHQVNIFFKDDRLMDHITLMDIAYTYQCKKKEPIHLAFKILELKRKTIRIINNEQKKGSIAEEKIHAVEKEWKEVQLQISENGVMSVRNVESSECSPIPGLEAPPVCSPSLPNPSSNHVNLLSLTSSSNSVSDLGMTSITSSQIVNSRNSLTLASPITSIVPPSPNMSHCLGHVGSSNIVDSSCLHLSASPVSTAVSSKICNIANSSSSAISVSVPEVTSPFGLIHAPISGSHSVVSQGLSSVASCVTLMSSSPLMTPAIMTSSPSYIPTPMVSSASSMIPILSATTPPPLCPAILNESNNLTANLSSYSQSVELGTVSVTTTMAAMKPTTNTVPTSFPIMSSPRPQTEPIVSVSKVSKDQVKKPNSVVEANKLSISRVPPVGIRGDILNKIVNKLSPNERVIGNTSVTIRPVTNTSIPTTKPYQTLKPHTVTQNSSVTVNREKPQPTSKYKTLKSPTKQWNPTIDRSTMLMKQSCDQSKPSRFFKMRNMPRFLGNPASGVKPMFACPEEPILSQPKQKLALAKNESKSSPNSSIPRSPTKQPPPYTPGSPKNKPPSTYNDPKPYLSPRVPSPAHSGNFLQANLPYHLLYNSYPSFSPDPNRMISPEILRSMCAYHPLNTSIGMLFNPMHTLGRPQDSFKPENTPAVQRIPPSKTETPPPLKVIDDKKPLPSPSPSDNIKSAISSASTKDEIKSIAISENTISQLTETATSQVLENVQSSAIEESNENKLSFDKEQETSNMANNNLVKINCEEVNLNNNNSKESQPSNDSIELKKTE